MRPGHTEAAVDLVRLAGLPPVGVISELVNDDGTMRRGQQLREFADEHGLALVSIADLVAYRQRRAGGVERVATRPAADRGRRLHRASATATARPDSSTSHWCTATSATAWTC